MLKLNLQFFAATGKIGPFVFKDTVNVTDAGSWLGGFTTPNSTEHSSEVWTHIGWGDGALAFWSSFVPLTVYTQSGGWVAPDLKTVFLDNSGDNWNRKTGNPKAIAWLLSNTTYQGTQSIVFYNNDFDVLDNGESVFVSGTGTTALSDIVIIAAETVSITYNGKTTSVSAGKTATMECAGKRMLTGVIISTG